MESEARRFLLGEMTEGERGAFEGMFVADEELFERVRVVEDELVESYLRETLSPAEREKFERTVLITERRRSRVEFTRTMLGKFTAQKEVADVKKTEPVAAVSPSVWNSIADFFKTPALAFGAASAILVLAFAGWFLLRNQNRPEIVRQITPTPTIQPTQPNVNENSTTSGDISVKPDTSAPGSIPDNKNGSSNANREAPTNNQNPNAPKQATTGITPILALFTGTVRAEGKTAELNLPEDAPGANLQLNLESQGYKIYRVEIINSAGTPVFQNNNLKAKNSRISLFVPAKKLARGDYLIKLSALNPQNEIESVADYTFRVNRK